MPVDRLLLMGTLATAALATPSSVGAQSPASLKEAVTSIQPNRILREIGVIADDSMRGRLTPSAGLEKTASYIAREFLGAGLNPEGDAHGFLQRYRLEADAFDTTASRIVVMGGPTLRFGPDALPEFPAGQDLSVTDTIGNVVVLSGRLTDSAAVANLGLRGAIVTIPLHPDRLVYQVLPAVRLVGSQGAAVILLTRADPDAKWHGYLAGAFTTRFRPTWQRGAGGSHDVPPLLFVREQSLAPVLAQRAVDLAALAKDTAEPARATPIQMRFHVIIRQTHERGATAPNVVGSLEGRDSLLKHQYVVFSAHMDHLGVGPPDARGDSIYNGADDDASGTIAVVELARAFSELRPAPKRSLIFVAVSGEEMGLWGSDYFTNHPPVPIEQIVADLNVDMIGRNWKDTIVAIGKEHSNLGTTLNQVAAAHPDLRMTAIDDIWPEEHFYSRSDHFNFARKGVPILFFFNGTHADYHRPSDEASKIDGEKESRIVKLLFYLGLELADRGAKPSWDPESYKAIVEAKGTWPP